MKTSLASQGLCSMECENGYLVSFPLRDLHRHTLVLLSLKLFALLFSVLWCFFKKQLQSREVKILKKDN